MKLGAFAALRMGVELMPHAARQLLPFVIFLVTVNVVYGAAIAMVQKDFKYVIGFSSVSHMGLVTNGLCDDEYRRAERRVMQMFSHGIMTALFFAVVGMVYDRAIHATFPAWAGSPKDALGGYRLYRRRFGEHGDAGFSGFVAELQIFMASGTPGRRGSPSGIHTSRPFPFWASS